MKIKKASHSYLDTPAHSLDEVLKQLICFFPLILLFFSFTEVSLAFKFPVRIHNHLAALSLPKQHFRLIAKHLRLKKRYLVVRQIQTLLMDHIVHRSKEQLTT